MKCPECLADTFPNDLENLIKHESNTMQSCSGCRFQAIPLIVVFFNKGLKAAVQDSGQNSTATPAQQTHGEICEHYADRACGLYGHGVPVKTSPC